MVRNLATRERVRFEKFDLGAFDNTGDPRFSIVLNNDTVWTPEWENLVLLLKYAIRTEAKNEAGDPQSNLVGTILTILNNNGYKVIQSPSEKTKKSGFLYECEITVKISDSIESTDVVYLQASDH